MSSLLKGAVGVLGIAVASGVGMNLYMKSIKKTSDAVQLSKLAATSLVQLADSKGFIENSSGRQALTGNSIWENTKGVCVMVIRRPGCKLCREEARDLASLFNEVFPNNNNDNSNDIKLVGVVKEELGVSKLCRDYFPFEISLDNEKEFYNEINGQSIKWSGFLMPDSWMNGRRADNKGIHGNFKGEGTILGGLLCVKNGSEINYVYNERVWGDHAPKNEVENALKQFQQLSKM